MSITKETRKESYEQVLSNLGERQLAVYTYLSRFLKGSTAKELAVKMYEDKVVVSPERNSVHPRLKELVDMGLVEVIDKTVCKYTSRKVAVYKAVINQ